jgi:hypothetical protein
MWHSISGENFSKSKITRNSMPLKVLDSITGLTIFNKI